jgi:hypothetical protein
VIGATATIDPGSAIAMPFENEIRLSGFTSHYGLGCLTGVEVTADNLEKVSE